MSDSAIRLLQQENIRLKRENAVYHQTNDQLLRYFNLIRQIFISTQKLPTINNPLILFNETLHQVCEAVGARDGSFSRYDEAQEALTFYLVYGDLRRQLRRFQVKTEEGIAGWVVEHQEPIVVNNPRQDWRFCKTVDNEFGFVTRSILTVPVIRHDQILGVIQLLNKKNGEFSDADLSLVLVLEQFAVEVFNTLQRRMTEDKVSELQFLERAYTSGNRLKQTQLDVDPAFADLLLSAAIPTYNRA